MRKPIAATQRLLANSDLTAERWNFVMAQIGG
jgi:hypothetical protein